MESSYVHGGRAALLTDLQDEIRVLGRTALIALGSSDHPVLYTTDADGRRVAVVAVRIGGEWWFIWGKRGQAPAAAPGRAARMLVRHPRSDVVDLFARRPRARGFRTGWAEAA
ncbi:hypothetical protein [Nocardiopsis potens]|uniref:hypothetical protein n=1 Tax=Nocardiopsis potens TaxID=1246458 RepID=UPI00034C7DC5|nr:hypothetical protein [Nocardiopsis potens]